MSEIIFKPRRIKTRLKEQKRKLDVLHIEFVKYYRINHETKTIYQLFIKINYRDYLDVFKIIYPDYVLVELKNSKHRHRIFYTEGWVTSSVFKSCEEARKHAGKKFSFLLF
jgi:hypothetical protein